MLAPLAPCSHPSPPARTPIFLVGTIPFFYWDCLSRPFFARDFSGFLGTRCVRTFSHPLAPRSHPSHPQFFIRIAFRDRFSGVFDWTVRQKSNPKILFRAVGLSEIIAGSERGSSEFARSRATRWFAHRGVPFWRGESGLV